MTQALLASHAAFCYGAPVTANSETQKSPSRPAEIVLSTLNSRYAHAAFGLRCLYANLGELQSCAELVEFEIGSRPIDVAEQLLARAPRLIGLGVYIWNVAQTLQLIRILKKIRPECLIVIGGPEVSFETAQQEIVAAADYTITGEADLAFAELCARLLRENMPPAEKVILPALPAVEALRSPYPYYSDSDLTNRVLYVEVSRGCPFTCEFCLSSLDVPVRQFALEPFLADMQTLLDRGARHFKFVDRTFNLNIRTGSAILEFFLARYVPGMFLHFEMIPDRLPPALRDLIKRFPDGALQFEVGIQSFNPEVCRLISRRQDNQKVGENFAFLRSETGVHIHADLIAGLPGEDLASFGAGFDRLMAMRPQEIQVGILKRLRGTPIVRHDVEWGMVYAAEPPYEVLQTRLMDFATLQKLRRFARYWDLVGNSGHFVRTLPLFWREDSPFESFMRFSEWLHAGAGRTHGIALKKLYELVRCFLVESGRGVEEVEAALVDDYRSGGHAFVPEFMRGRMKMRGEIRATNAIPRRQARHLARR